MTSTLFIKPMSIRVFNSNSVSVITSAGIHALLLGLLLPNLTDLNPLQKSDHHNQRDVEIIELTSAEITRLPDQLPLLDIHNFPKSFPTDIPVLDSFSLSPSAAPNTFNALPALPALPAPPALPALPALPSLNSARPSFPRPLPKPQRSLPTSSLPNLPSRLSLSPQPTSKLDNSQSSTSRFPPISKKPDFGLSKAPVTIDQLINQDRGDLDHTPTLQKPIFRNVTPPKIAFNAEQARKDRLINNLLRETIEGADNLRYNKNNTTNEDARRNDVQWMAKIGSSVTKKENWQALRGDYPKAACLRHLEGTAIYGITVNPEGNVAKNPYLIKSSGYGLLNQQAFNQIKSTNFSTDGQLQHYRVRISFSLDPKICPAVTQSPQNQPDESTTPETPVESAKPTSDSKLEPTIREMSIPETPVESAKPTSDSKLEPTIREMSTPETPVKSAKPTSDSKLEPTTIPTFSQNTPPLPPSIKK
ncbi:TonB family protein [cyanobacterium endosymbiont of Epithemia turgida]|uniref:TonB family protein n=1 Tax=cyanobacterium endosymbiont of Epithemia turgida TaxID=718217 RepID=UPI000696F2BD|nr:TonB family protein [cyanobacterium endosymbiont of Epithemia turgida]